MSQHLQMYNLIQLLKPSTYHTGLIEAELGEYLLESLRVLLRPSPSFDTGAAGISHHAAALRQLSGAAPIAFYSIAHFPPMIFRELLALIYPLLVRGGSGHDAALHGEEEGGEDALLALLDVLEGALAHSTVLFSEEALETLLQTLHEATARQLQRQQQQQDALCSPMLRRLALFVGRYVSSEVINNKALFPSPPQLEALLQALCGLLHVLLLLPPQGRIDVGGASTVLMAAAFPLLQVADLVTSRITPTRDGADMEEDEGDGRRATKEASHPSLPALVEAAAALASLAAAQQTVSRDPCDDYTCALFLSRVIVLLRDGPCLLHLTRRLLDAGLLETALLRLADAGGNGDDEHHTAALLSLAARLLTHGAGMQGAAVVEEARDPLLALARDLRQAQKHQHQQAAAADGQGEEMEVGAGRLSDGHPCQIVRRWLVGVVRRLADPLQLQRWNGVGTTRASSICNLDALLAVRLPMPMHLLFVLMCAD